MYTGQPNIFRWLTSCFSLENIYSGVLFPRILWEILLCTYIVVLATSAHRYIGRSWSWIMNHSFYNFHDRSILPFCHTIFLWIMGMVSSLLIPCSLQYSLNSLDVNSPPLSDLKILILFTERFSTRALNSLNFSKTSSLFFKK